MPRPKGSKNKNKIIRPDKQPLTEQGDNSRFLLHDMKLLNLPRIDVNNPEEMKQRVNDYFSICSDDDMKPSIASLALSFGISRTTLFYWITGKVGTIQNAESLNTLKRAYDTINSYYEHLMNNGRINPVAGIFLLKNNMGYKDTTEYIVTAEASQDPTIDDIGNRAGLLSD